MIHRRLNNFNFYTHTIGLSFLGTLSIPMRGFHIMPVTHQRVPRLMLVLLRGTFGTWHLAHLAWTSITKPLLPPRIPIIPVFCSPFSILTVFQSSSLQALGPLSPAPAALTIILGLNLSIVICSCHFSLSLLFNSSILASLTINNGNTSGKSVLSSLPNTPYAPLPHSIRDVGPLSTNFTGFLKTSAKMPLISSSQTQPSVS